MSVIHKNGKTDRRERIRAAAQAAAKRAVNISNDTQVIDIEHPMVIGGEGIELNVFDVHDTRPRLMFIVEKLSPEAAKAQNRTSVLHALRWNCSPFIAHSIAVDGVNFTRGQELQEVERYQQQIIAQANGSSSDDIIPSDYVIEGETGVSQQAIEVEGEPDATNEG